MHTTRTLHNLDAGNSFIVHLHSESVGLVVDSVYCGKNKNIKTPRTRSAEIARIVYGFLRKCNSSFRIRAGHCNG